MLGIALMTFNFIFYLVKILDPSSLFVRLPPSQSFNGSKFVNKMVKSVTVILLGKFITNS